MLKRLAALLSAALMSCVASAAEPTGAPQYQSAFMRAELAADQPAFVALALDSLGKSKLSMSPLRTLPSPASKYELRRTGDRFEYHAAGVPSGAPPAWTFAFSTKQMELHSSYSRGFTPPPLLLNFNPHLNHATLLGLINDDGSVRLPALLHVPDYGTLRITSNGHPGLALGYDAVRDPDEKKRADDFIKVTFPAASAASPELDYTLEVVAIHPELLNAKDDPRFDGVRRNWLNIFQLNPRVRALANHAGSDVCAFTIFEYSAIAARTPPLAPGLTALDLIRQSLDRYLAGMKAYGIAGYVPNDPSLPYDFLDTYPSLLITAWDYVRGTNDQVWLKKNYPGLKGWATKLLAMDRDGDGLFEYPETGNSGSWDRHKFTKHAANWWDDIGFGNKDAYSNALAYHALLVMSEMARQADQPEDAALYASRAEKLRSIYLETFYNPETGVLAGWKSADGKLHDYYFTFVNGVAITYGLIPNDQANQIMDRMLAKMKEVGYTRFEYGLPGNLIPIRREDYLESRQAWGGGDKEDGSEGFQIYENGGATACYAYFTMQALYQLGRYQDADAILFPMLRAFDEGGFQGFQGPAPDARTYDWKSWDGKPYGYEGLLVDGYMALLAALSH
jgi:hypothetical protein